MRRELLNRINQLPGATERLVDMRADLLRFCKSDPTLKKTDQDFQHLFRSWFNRGFLVLRQINWTTPANILEKIIKYEAVHAIGDWDDLRRRLQPDDRRCFAFFHPSIPDDPLIFVEVGLCKGIPNSIQTLLSDKRKILDNTRADTAVFYSISNCQVGLAGISFGNSLIKQVVRDLSGELPNLETFVTLSPMPGFADWLGLQAKAGKESLAARLLAAREEALADGKADVLQTLEPQLLLLGAHYLSSKKHPDGLPLDPVERFHLSNGAMIHDIHAGADMSHNGLKQSCGLMANYLYDLRKVETNHEEFARKGIINASRKLENLAKQKLA
jgi:malonyl-CoA decarboxylase